MMFKKTYSSAVQLLIKMLSMPFIFLIILIFITMKEYKVVVCCILIRWFDDYFRLLYRYLVEADSVIIKFLLLITSSLMINHA